MSKYSILRKQNFSSGCYAIVPIRMEDRFAIMQWRNEQIYHLRQNAALTIEEQDIYFNTVVAALFDQEQPSQILFSFLENEKCIGYGGLVHINWTERLAEISFIMETALEEKHFEQHWMTFLGLIEDVAFSEIGFRRIFTYAYDIRPRLYIALESCGFKRETVLPDHIKIDNETFDVVIHSKTVDYTLLRNANMADVSLTFQWASDPEVRKFSFSQSKIELLEHQNWFARRINDPSCEYYILFDGQNEIGSIRFDIEDSGSAMISYLIDPAHHGKGYGRMILEQGVQRLKARRNEVKSVYGLVQPANIASIRIFDTMGFVQTSVDASLLRFEKNLQS